MKSQSGWRVGAVVVVLALACVGVSQAQATNLVVNGGFETGDATGWTLVPAAGGSLMGISGNSNTGSWSFSFGAVGFLDDTLSQQIVPTVAGNSYLIDFWLDHPANDAQNHFNASWDGGTLVDMLNVGAFGYTEFTFTEIATSASTPIQFGSYEVPSWFYLDDVSVTDLGPAGGAVPEPLTMFSAFMAISGLGAYLRKRVRK
jgi:hypothetical protein